MNTASRITARNLSRSALARRFQGRRGAAVAEFAIVLPFVLFPLVVGMIELGRSIQFAQAVVNASREGAREAVQGGKSEADVITTVNDFLEASGVAAGQIGVTIQPSGGLANMTVGDPVTVTVWVPYSAVTLVPGLNFIMQPGSVSSVGADGNLRASTTMRKEAL